MSMEFSITKMYLLHKNTQTDCVSVILDEIIIVYRKWLIYCQLYSKICDQCPHILCITIVDYACDIS